MYMCVCVLGVFAFGQECREQSGAGAGGDCGYGWLMLEKIGGGRCSER